MPKYLSEDGLCLVFQLINQNYRRRDGLLTLEIPSSATSGTLSPTELSNFNSNINDIYLVRNSLYYKIIMRTPLGGANRGYEYTFGVLALENKGLHTIIVNNETGAWQYVWYPNDLQPYTAGYGLNLADHQFSVDIDVIAKKEYVEDEFLKKNSLEIEDSSLGYQSSQIKTIKLNGVSHNVPISSFKHDQRGLSKTWVINHNLGRFPQVICLDSANSTLIGEVKYVDQNNLTVEFSCEVSGIAYLS